MRADRRTRRAVRRRVVAVAILLCGLATGPGLAGESSSPSYVLTHWSADSGTEDAGSTRWALAGSLGQEATVGTSSSPHFILVSGLWGFLGTGLVPVVLGAGRNAVTPEHVDLSWSGNDPPYEVYDAADCADVFGSYYDSTYDNAYPDVDPPAARLVCFNVLATAPGPEPPPPAP